MLPGLGGMDPRKMEQMMRQMGIKSRKIEAKRIIIESSEGKYVISSPDVTEIDMQGHKSLQIVGDMKLEDSISSDDIAMVMEQTSCSEEDAKAALKKSGGDIAEAILSLKGK